MCVPFRFVVRLPLALTIVLAACGGDGPSASALREELAAQLPAFVEAASLDVQSAENKGTDAAPEWASSFVAGLRLREDLYQEFARDGDVLLLVKVGNSGEEKQISGTALSALLGENWQNSLSIADNATASLGQPRSAFNAARVIIVGTDEERQYLDEKRAVVLSSGSFSGEATSSGAEFPLVIRFTSFDPASSRIQGQVEWSSLGARKAVAGTLDGRSLLLRETDWIDHGDGSALFGLEYRLELTGALDGLEGTWSGSGYSGRVEVGKG